MGQVLMTSTYVGMSDFRFEAKVDLFNGRQLGAEEVRRRGLLTDDIVRRHERSDYVHEWYEIEPGDVISLVATQDHLPDEEEVEWSLGVTKPLIDPPQTPDGPYVGRDFEAWLRMNLQNA